MIDLRNFTQKQSKLSVIQKQGVEQFMKDIEEHINKIASVWHEVSPKRKNELLAHSPIVAWVVSLTEGLR